MRRSGLERVGRGLLPVVAYGDAAGLPVETMSAAEINRKYGRIIQLLAPAENPFYAGDWPAGSTSDDTQLSVVMAESLIEAGGYDIAKIADGHIEAYESIKTVDNDGKIIARGWGGSTARSMERLLNGASYRHSGEHEGAGNGVLMKMAPLVYWQIATGASDDERHRQYDEVTSLTHDSHVARACTQIHGDVLSFLLRHGSSITKDVFVEMLHETITKHGRGLEAELDSLEVCARMETYTEDVIRSTYAHSSGYRYGFYAPETLAITYAVFLSGGSFDDAVYRAVNIGGDTDSVASMTATMYSFAHNGKFEIPHDMESIQDYDKLTKVSYSLTTVALADLM